MTGSSTPARGGSRIMTSGRPLAATNSSLSTCFMSVSYTHLAKQARLRYATLGAGTHYTLVEVELLTGRHHQIRTQLSKIGCPIRGDLKYGARRSLPGGGISLHSRSVQFEHPVRHEPVAVTAPVPADDNLWAYFENR